MALTFKQLKYFLAVVETGKVSDAAVKANISPSSITEAVKDLEHFLKTELFTRSKKGLALTTEGFRFLGYAKRIISEVDSAKHFVHDYQHNIEGILRVGITITVSGYFLSRLVQRFSKSFPNVRLQLEEHPREKLEKMIGDETLDVAILLVSNVSSRKSRKIIPLLQSHRRLWVCHDHHFLEQESVSLQDISKEPYIQLAIDEAATTTTSYWSKFKLSPNVIFQTDSVESVRSMVATGAGVTILSDMVHRPWSLDGDRIHTIPIKQNIPTMDTGLIWNVSQTSNPLVKYFSDFCRIQYTSGV